MTTDKSSIGLVTNTRGDLFQYLLKCLQVKQRAAGVGQSTRDRVDVYILKPRQYHLATQVDPERCEPVNRMGWRSGIVEGPV